MGLHAAIHSLKYDFHNFFINIGMPLTCRAVFIIGRDKKLKLSILYPATTGRNFDEVLRVIDSLQLTAVKKVATPADWQNGGSCMVVSNQFY